MNLTTLILLALRASIILNVFALGLHAPRQNVIYLLQRPRKLLFSLLSMFIVMPLIAVILLALFEMHPAVRIALVALAVSPIPPLLPKQEQAAGGHASYAFGLLTITALLAIVFVPLAVELFGMLYDKSTHMSLLAITKIVLLVIVVPLAASATVNQLAPAFAKRIAQPVSFIANISLLAIVIPIVYGAWPEIVLLLGNGTVVALLLFVLAGFAAGHFLGGPEPEGRVVLAFSSAIRHPGIAIAIASSSFPDQKLTSAAVLLYLIITGIVSIPYKKWRNSCKADRT
jgi:bile acid:Na+ symporter, BASS family